MMIQKIAILLIISVVILGCVEKDVNIITPTPIPTSATNDTSLPSPIQTFAPNYTSLSTPVPTTGIKADFTNSVGMEFLQMFAGEFDMGSQVGEEDSGRGEVPVHRVKISNAFYMGKFEVTQKQWRDVMGTNPSQFKGDNLPVRGVSWDDVQEFIKKLNEKEGANKYRLPSEAEWEYAARAGTTTRFSFGDDESSLGDYAWYMDNSGANTHNVGQKKPNPWGLYDMHGNAEEWVQDFWHNNYNGAPTDGSVWEKGFLNQHVVRGGSYSRAFWDCRSATRGSGAPDVRYVYADFRLLRVL